MDDHLGGGKELSLCVTTNQSYVVDRLIVIYPSWDGKMGIRLSFWAD